MIDEQYSYIALRIFFDSQSESSIGFKELDDRTAERTYTRQCYHALV